MSDMADSPGLKDESIDPKTFVQNIRALGMKRDQEDAERHRMLEEQILQGRTERAARRAERQRTLSISPDKRHSFGSARSIDSPRSPHERPAASPSTMEPTSPPGSPGEALKRLTGSSAGIPEIDNTSPTRKSASPLSRSGTLSWQQRRPASSSGRRPLSMRAPDSASARPSSSGRNEAPKPETDTVPRSQIAQSLGARDPSWFRQTPDRGEGSPAYRKDTDETVSEAGSGPTKKQLPGMSRESRTDMSESTPPGSSHSSLVSRDSIRDSTAASARFSTNTSMSGVSNQDSKSPMPTLESQRFHAPGSRPASSHADDHGSPDRGMAMSSAQGRIAHDRSPSPTKGMGGFVQSAMMKRTESVNKRWSQQTPGRLSRQDSTASNSSAFGGLLDNTPRLESTPRSPSREPLTRPRSHSRPASSHSNLTITHGGAEEPQEPKMLDSDGFARPSTPRSLHSRGKSLSALRARSSNTEGQSENGSPVSPSKRFSPTKSTWLESAINRPESPSMKPKAPPPQPSWMAEIQKNKAHRASVDLSKRGSIDLGNVPESPAWVSKADTIRGAIRRRSTLASAGKLPPNLAPSPSEEITDAQKPRAPSPDDKTASSPSSKPATLSTSPAGMESVATTTTATVVNPAIGLETQGPKATEKPRPALKSPSLRSPSSPLDAAAKTDSPPKRDFRTNLKARQAPGDGGKKEELEFQNVFGKLKKAQQERFVAPDELKGNIVRGKVGLTKTDGPKPRERKDELRQSLIAQKEAIKAKTEEGGSPQRRKQSVSAASPTVPEALAKRRELGRNDSISKASPSSSPVGKDPPTPEAIARQKHLRERSKSSASATKEEPLGRKPSVQENPNEDVPEVPKPSLPDKPAEEPVKPLAGRPTAPTEKPTEEPAKPSWKRQPSLTEKKEDPAEPVKPLTKKPTLPAEKPAEEPPKPLARKPTAPVEKPAEEPPKPLTRKPTAPAEKPAEEPARPSWKRQPSLSGKAAEKPAEPIKPLTKRPTIPADKPAEEPAKPSWKRQQSFPDKPSDAPTKPLPVRPTPPSDKPAEEPVVPSWKKQTSLSSKDKDEPAKPFGAKSSLSGEKAKDGPPKPWERPQALPGMAKEEAPKSLSRKPSMPETPQGEATKPLSRDTSSSDKKSDESPTKATSRMSAKLAERFNPALAGVLARVPSPMAGNSTADRQSGGPPSGAPTAAGADEPPAESKELTHITKGRARGPKRRAPAAKKEAETEVKSPPVTAASLAEPKDVLPSTESTADKVVTPKPIRISGNFGSKGPKPPTPVKSPDLIKRLSSMSLTSPLASPTLEKDMEGAFATAGSENSSPQLNKRSSLRKSIPPERPSSPKPIMAELEKRFGPRAGAEKPASPKPTSPLVSQSRFDQDSRPLPNPPTSNPVPAEAPKTASPLPSPAAAQEPKQENVEPKPLFQSRFNQATRSPLSSPAPKPTPAELPKPRSPLPSPPAENFNEEKTVPKPGFQSRFNQAARLPLSSPGPKPAPDEPPKPTSPLPSPPAEEPQKEKIERKPLLQSRFKQDTPPSLSSSSKPLPSEPPKVTRPLPTPPAPEASKPEKVEPKQESEAPSVKNAAAQWGRTSPSMTRAKSPIKLPTRKDEETANEEAGLNRPEPPPEGPIGLGLAGVVGAPKSTPLIRKPVEREPIEQPKVATRFPLTPPSSGGLPLKPERRPSRSSDPISPIPQSTEAGKLFADFFDEAPVTTGKLDVDTNAILNNNVLDQGKTKTLRKQMQEITGDGKTSPVPEQEEFILYDESMYICTHVFATSNGGKNTEVYLWTGSAVPEPLVEDTQLFARKIAKDAGGQLLIMKQGKEMPGFFQALGGSLIIRKGSRSERSNEYMLCVRHHLGHIVLDEVELSLSNLCSGFAYLVTSRTGLLAGKVFLWRGAGCKGDELGCARLLGSDLGLTPGFTEIEEGKEPSDFLSIFPSPAAGPKIVPASSPHWKLKAKADKNYAVRLFRVDEHKQAQNGGFQVSSLWPSLMRRVSSQSLPSPTSSVPQTPVCGIAEIAPFDQMDVEAEHIYVLDAFFEMYIIVGALSQSQSHAFSTALLFAQEFGILAASAQDRPFVPDTKVVLEGVPRDMKFAFRRWNDAAMPTSALMAGRPRTANGLRIVPLSAAIAATRE